MGKEDCSRNELLGLIREHFNRLATDQSLPAVHRMLLKACVSAMKPPLSDEEIESHLGVVPAEFRNKMAGPA